MRSPRNGSPRLIARRFPLSRAGFTLVEVTLALGIISFAFVAMFGILPVGLNVSRQAIDTTIEAQIVQKLTSQALQTDFSQLGMLPSAAPYFFSEEGKTATQANSLYKAGFSVATSTALSGNVSTQKLATVSIYILNTRGQAVRAAANVTTASDAKKFTILIPDNGL